MKKCFKCLQIKPLTEFYKHKEMADGHLNKCKSCAKNDVNSNRLSNIEHYRNYDRKRGSRQDASYVRLYRATYPKKYAAHKAVANSVKAGILIPQACECCGDLENIHAHHDDYAKQLEIRWLCTICHKKWHVENGEGLNGK